MRGLHVVDLLCRCQQTLITFDFVLSNVIDRYNSYVNFRGRIDRIVTRVSSGELRCLVRLSSATPEDRVIFPMKPDICSIGMSDPSSDVILAGKAKHIQASRRYLDKHN